MRKPPYKPAPLVSPRGTSAMRCTRLHQVTISPSSAVVASEVAAPPGGCPPRRDLESSPARSTTQLVKSIAAMVCRPAGDASAARCANLGVQRSMRSATLASCATPRQPPRAGALEPTTFSPAQLAVVPAAVQRSTYGRTAWRRRIQHGQDTPPQCAPTGRGKQEHSLMGPGTKFLQSKTATLNAVAAG